MMKPLAVRESLSRIAAGEDRRWSWSFLRKVSLRFPCTIHHGSLSPRPTSRNISRLFTSAYACECMTGASRTRTINWYDTKLSIRSLLDLGIVLRYCRLLRKVLFNSLIFVLITTTRADHELTTDYRRFGSQEVEPSMLLTLIRSLVCVVTFCRSVWTEKAIGSWHLWHWSRIFWEQVTLVEGVERNIWFNMGGRYDRSSKSSKPFSQRSQSRAISFWL